MREVEGSYPLRDTVYEYFVDSRLRVFVSWEERLPQAWKFQPGCVHEFACIGTERVARRHVLSNSFHSIPKRLTTLETESQHAVLQNHNSHRRHRSVRVHHQFVAEERVSGASSGPRGHGENVGVPNRPEFLEHGEIQYSDSKYVCADYFEEHSSESRNRSKKVFRSMTYISVVHGSFETCILQDTVESRLEKRTKGIYIPTGNKILIAFMDDFNMPMKETYGSQPPLELIRQLMGYGFW